MDNSRTEDWSSSRGAQRGIKLNISEIKCYLSQLIIRLMQAPSSKLQRALKLIAHNIIHYSSGFKYTCFQQMATISVTTLVNKRQSLCPSSTGMCHQPSQFSCLLADMLGFLEVFVPTCETFLSQTFKKFDLCFCRCFPGYLDFTSRSKPQAAHYFVRSILNEL